MNIGNRIDVPRASIAEPVRILVIGTRPGIQETLVLDRPEVYRPSLHASLL
jgi:hypothetical protein